MNLYSSKSKSHSVVDNRDIFIFIRSYNRPLYLWACLDSIYRKTPSECKIVLVDNASTDKRVREVISGFVRRDMFYAVHYMDENRGSNQQMIYYKYADQLGPYFFLLDSDIIIETKERGSWVRTMLNLAEENDEIGLLGSIVDKSDFIEDNTAKEIVPSWSKKQINQVIKGASVERKRYDLSKEVITPHRPPGRLLLVRTAAIDSDGLPIGNKRISDVVIKNGYTTGISTAVVHRHLSLLNLYDYPDYDYQELRKYLG